jgi:hypothetical protein
MLNRLDDYPVHQTSEPLAVPVTSDRNFYDRSFYNGYAADGAYQFGLCITFYPHRQILDCQFSVRERGGRQHCFFASRRAPSERTDMVVGPLRYEILEPMRQARVVLDDNDTGLGCDLLFTAQTAPLQEAHLTLWSGNRRVRDSSRFVQLGRWQGAVRHPDGVIAVDPAQCRATKDRSWGVRAVGEREGGAPAPPSRGIFFLWAPLNWGDHVSHMQIYEDGQGRSIHREGLVAPLHADPCAAEPAHEPRTEHMADVRARLTYAPGTRYVASAELDLIDERGLTRTIRCDPLLRFMMKGLGYGHPKWGHGRWQGELVIGHESFLPEEIEPSAMENLHVEQIVRVTDGVREGVGILEHICTAP